METLKILQQYDAMATITLVASLVTILSFILLMVLLSRYYKCLSQRNSARFTIDRLKDDLKFLHKKYDEQVRELVGELGQLRDVNARVVVLRQELPERRPTDSDAKYLQRCRMAVITKAYDFAQVFDGAAQLMVLSPSQEPRTVSASTIVGIPPRTSVEGPKTAGLNLLEEELSAMKADPRTARELIDLTDDTW